MKQLIISTLSVLLLSACIGDDFVPGTEVVDPMDNTIYFSGNIVIEDTITTESLQAVVIRPGTTINFGPEGIIVANGDVSVEGTADQPVHMIGSQSLADHRLIQVRWDAINFTVSHTNIIDGFITSVADYNILTHVNFTNTKGLKWNTAAARFWNGNVMIEDCHTFGNNSGEGILVHDAYAPQVRNCTFSKTPDAIEFINCDDGVISGNIFRDMSDDGVDNNACANTLITNNEFYNIKDRALELGSENFGSSFNLQVNNNLFVGCDVAVNVRGSSEVHVSNSTFYDINVAFEILTSADSTRASYGSLDKSVLVNCNTYLNISSTSQSEITDCIADTGEMFSEVSANILRDPENGDFSIVEEYLPDGIDADEIGYQRQ